MAMKKVPMAGAAGAPDQVPEHHHANPGVTTAMIQSALGRAQTVDTGQKMMKSTRKWS